MTRNELKEIIKECIEERNSILEYKELYWDQFDRKDESKIIDLATKASKIVYNNWKKDINKKKFFTMVKKAPKGYKIIDFDGYLQLIIDIPSETLYSGIGIDFASELAKEMNKYDNKYYYTSSDDLGIYINLR